MDPTPNDRQQPLSLIELYQAVEQCESRQEAKAILQAYQRANQEELDRVHQLQRSHTVQPWLLRTMPTKVTTKIDRIVSIDDSTTAIVCPSKADAQSILMKNPHCSYEQNGDDYILVFDNSQLNLLNAVKRA